MQMLAALHTALTLITLLIKLDDWGFSYAPAPSDASQAVYRSTLTSIEDNRTHTGGMFSFLSPSPVCLCHQAGHRLTETRSQHRGVLL